MDIMKTLHLPNDARWVSCKILYLFLNFLDRVNQGNQNEASGDFNTVILLLRKKLNRGINLEVLNMPCFLLAWKYLSQANKLQSLLYQRRGVDSKIHFLKNDHARQQSTIN